MINELKRTFKTLTRSQEILFLLNDLKPVVRLDVYQNEIGPIIEFCKNNNLKLRKSDFKVIKCSDGDKGSFSNKGIIAKANSQETGVAYLYLSKSEEKAEKAKQFEASRNDKEFGKILDYPDCCIDFFIRNKHIQEQKQNDYILPAFKASEGFVFPFHNNILARYFDFTLLSHFPCNFKCKKSAGIAKKNLDCIGQNSKERQRTMEDMLKNAVLYTENSGVFILRNSRLEKNSIFFKKVIASANNHIFAMLKKTNKIDINMQDQPIINNEKIEDSALMAFI